MKPEEKKPDQKSGRAGVPVEPLSEIRGVLKDAKINLFDKPRSLPVSKKIHARRPLPLVPDKKSVP